MSPFQAQRKYIQNYRKKWELMKGFKDWLKPYPKDRTKAYCEVCNVIVKAHLCDLRKHGVAKKHIEGLKVLKSLKDLKEEEPEITISEEEIDIEEEDDEETVDKWPSQAVTALLKYLKDHWDEYNSGLRKKKDIMEQISQLMEQDGFKYSSVDCSRKFRNIKLRYYSVLEKKLRGEQVTTRIHYFNDLHKLISDQEETIDFIEDKKSAMKEESKNSILPNSKYEILTYDNSEWSENCINIFLDLLLEFKDVFTGKEEDNKIPIWQSISNHMNLEGYPVKENECRSRWKQLVETFNEHDAEYEQSGTLPLWPFYTKVRQILSLVQIPEDSETKTVIKKKSGRGRGRGRPRKHPRADEEERQSIENNGVSEDEAAKVKKRNVDHALIRRINRLNESAEVWERLNTIENQLDHLGDQQEIQRTTNTLLAQILSELSTLASNISPKSSPRDGITLVVPNSDH